MKKQAREAFVNARMEWTIPARADLGGPSFA